MIIQPEIWGFLCSSAHPLGCAANVRAQIEAARAHDGPGDGPQRALIIGAASGYGLAARITAAFGYGAATIGVFNEKPARRRRTASAGWYNAAAFEHCAQAAGINSTAINADAFAHATRDRVIDTIHQRFDGSVDLVVYSLAAPLRTLPDSGATARAVIKPIGTPFTSKTIDTDADKITDITVAPATDDEIDATVQVMGGEDWQLWLDALAAAGVLAANARTIAFSYHGPAITRPIYAHGTIGRAKQHLEATAQTLRQRHALEARVAVMKSLVTRASVAIPGIPLYLSLVYRVMKDKGLHETAIEQQIRLFRDYLYPRPGQPATLDDQGRFRLDARELRDDVQQACAELWPRINNATLFELTDYAGYKREFMQLFGFARNDIDYTADVAVDVALARGDMSGR